MIENMALLKRTMQQMDAEDPVVSQAAKDRAAEILGEAKLNFSKMAEWIEQRRLLLRPTIIARIKRMDQPGILGDSAFRDTGSALRKEGQSFLQIAEAIEAAGQPAPRYADPVQESQPAPATVTEGEPHHPMVVDPDPGPWLMTLILLGGFLTFPFRHPLRFLVVALFAVVLFYAYRGVVTLGHEVTGYFDGSGVAAVRHGADTAISSVSSFIHEQILRQGKETAESPTPTPSPTAAAASPSPTPSPAPSATELASPAPPVVTPAPRSTEAAAPPAAPPRRDTRPPPAKAAANCDHFTASGRCASDDSRARAFESVTPEGFRRNSRLAGPCRHGVGGCNWGGVQY